MTSADRVNQLSKDEFAALWNGAATLEGVVEKVIETVGKVPRWAVMARATVLRMEGMDLKRFVAAGIDG